MIVSLKKHYLLLFLSLFQYASNAQLGKVWPYSAKYPYTLQGAVQSWVMKGEEGIIRTQSFAPNGSLLEDKCEKNIGRSLSPFPLVPSIKAHLEQTYIPETPLKAGTKLKFNKRLQLLEKQEGTSHTINSFDEQGNILLSRTKHSVTKTRAWNSIHHAEPTYTFTNTIQTLTLFKYNKAGLLIEFEYYNTDPSKNFRVVYKRDTSGFLIERLSYDELDIRQKADDNMKRIAAAAKDNTFDINTIYPSYWSDRSPLKEYYKNDIEGRKTAYICHCLSPNNVHFPSFKATWEYDDKGHIHMEQQYSRPTYNAPYQPSATLLYDDKENIIQEKVTYGEKEFLFTYEITYYK
ncbi:MAG: hypothetical protein ACRBFS_22705 [Aureispira sp.]